MLNAYARKYRNMPPQDMKQRPLNDNPLPGVGYAPKNPEVLRCPVCRREALIPGGTVLGFKTNMRLMKLLQMVKLRGELKEGNVQCVGCAEQAK